MTPGCVCGGVCGRWVGLGLGALERWMEHCGLRAGRLVCLVSDYAWS